MSTVVVHGGCGNPRGDTVRDEPDYHDALRAAVAAADAVLEHGGAALDAAQAAVESLEDAPQFNAGRGSVLTAEGTVEMDAALMSGHDGRAGAVAVVTTPRHPVALARAVMDATPHVMLAGYGAERLAGEQSLEQMAPDWFVTDRQRERWWKGYSSFSFSAGGRRFPAPTSPTPPHDESGGTVGAVVLDDEGRLAAATSTGGTSGQLAGRVGDSPLIGAGTWADEHVAVSMTGDGEGIVRSAAARTVAALVEHAGLPLADACDRVVATIEGDAGLIAVDRDGNVALPFDTKVMHRAWRISSEQVETAVWAVAH